MVVLSYFFGQRVIFGSLNLSYFRTIYGPFYGCWFINLDLTTWMIKWVTWVSMWQWHQTRWLYILSKTAISPVDNMCLPQKANHSVQRFSTSILYASSLSRFLYCCFWCYILNFLHYFLPHRNTNYCIKDFLLSKKRSCLQKSLEEENSNSFNGMYL